jgi:DNA-binding NtrC family response regulator
MEISKIDVPGLPTVFRRPDQVFGKFLMVNLGPEGKILHIENRDYVFFDSLIRDLEKAGNIRHYFDISPYQSLDQIPQFQKPACINDDPFQNDTYVIFVNSRDFPREEYPELFYTTIPSALLSVCRTGKDRYCGIIRIIQTIPEIYLERSNGIIYIDEKERLIGFNHTFYEFFEFRHRDPLKMLMKPISAFLNPTPEQIQQDKLKYYGQADEQALESLYRLGDPGITFSKTGCDQTLPDGLVLKNPDHGNLFCKLPVRVDTRFDFRLEIEAELMQGGLPLMTIGKVGTISDYPDRFGYLIGPDINRNRYILKRKGLINVMGERIKPMQRLHMELLKTGNALYLRIGGKQVLAFYDSNFLHTDQGMITFGLRQGGVCRFRQVHLRCARETFYLADVPTVIKLNTPEQRYFVLNRINLIHLAINYPYVSAYVLENVTEIQKQVNVLEHQFQKLQEGADVPTSRLVSKSAIMESIKQKARLVAESDATVLIQGATGTGKEVMAHYIHSQSLRHSKPFIKVDCSTIPRELVESELFGHEKGSFTGAGDRKIGLFEQADQGTLLLDEVANLTFEMQKKLLQFLQDHTITRVGGQTPIPLNLRIIVAANIPLMNLVEQGQFRADLFYRIDVVSIFLPPLKERKEDIPDLCDFFIQEMNKKHNRTVKELSSPALEKILGYEWPGNVRELRNVIERAVLFCKADKIKPELIQFSGTLQADPAGERKRHQFITTDIKEIGRLFREHRGQAKKVAQALDIAPRTLYYQIKRLGFSVEDIRSKGYSP